MKHTPGPWMACREGDCICGQVWSRPADHPVATVISGEWGDSPRMSYGSVDPEASKANARLIAAAPELLDAAKAFVDAWDKCLQLEKTDVALRLARAAIAKAEDTPPC